MSARSRPTRRRARREQSLQKSVVAFHAIAVKDPSSAILFAVPNGEKRDKATAAMLSGMSAEARELLPEWDALRPAGLGVLPGAPDLILLVSDGRVILIELKRPKAPGSSAGTLSTPQKRFRKAASRLGHRYEVLDDVDAYGRLLEQLGVALRLSPRRPNRIP